MCIKCNKSEVGHNENNNRNSGLDLFKSLCMLFVIAFHFTDHGNIELSCSQPLTFNWCLLSGTWMFGGICNCSFMLMSGFFLYGKKTKFRSLFKLWLQVFFYSVGSGIILYNLKAISLKGLLLCFLPITINQYWYFSAYILIYLFFPFINKFVSCMSKKALMSLLMLSFLCFSVYYTIFYTRWMEGTVHILLFLFMYIAGAYVRKFSIQPKFRRVLLIAGGTVFLEFLSTLFMRGYYKLTGIDIVWYLVYESEKVFPVITSVLLFLLFKQLKPYGGKIWNFLSTSVFGVYLLHIGLLNSLFFKVIFDNSSTFYSSELLSQLVLAMISLFFIGIIVDKIRIILFEKPLLILLSPLLEKVEGIFVKLYPEDY